MTIFGGALSITGITFLMFSIAIIAALGYALGRITIKGVSLGTAGVFIVALLYGAVLSKVIESTLVQTVAGEAVSYSTNALKIVENIGLILFVTSVGFIAGPSFFKNLKQNYKSYILLGLVIILAGAGTCVACFYVGRGAESDPKEFVAMLVGLLSGSLTSTPAFSAAKATVAAQ
ncbi:MAG: permease, partial [Ruminococcus sp.]|nr:permease [Ruminococcus sp.]